jgi:hypothetical protein
LVPGLGSVQEGGLILRVAAALSEPLNPASVAGGQFREAGGVATFNLARWAGTEWRRTPTLLPYHD